MPQERGVTMLVRAASNAAWLAPGCRLDRYDLLLQVAEGGMGSLWLARQEGKHGFDRIVAIKTILPRLASDAGFRGMFLDEARVVSRIEHPNVAQVLDLGEERGVLFLVMEWIDGEALNKVARACGGESEATIPVGVLGRVMVDVCEGLHAAHEISDDDGLPLGVVHRDVSPHNLLVGFRGTTKVVDFGIAKARNRMAQDTSVGLVKGKIAYMAPEQAMGAEVDRRTDVWSAGATMYRFLAGRVPYAASEPVATLRRLTAGLPPASLPESVPRAIRLVVEKAIELDPAKRFETARAMGVALSAAMRVADVDTTHDDVAAFMRDHLGEGHATRSQEIEHAVRASRARMRVGLAGTSPGLGREVPITERPESGGGDPASPRPRPSGRPTALVGLRPSLAPTNLEVHVDSHLDSIQAPPSEAPVPAAATVFLARPAPSVGDRTPRRLVRWVAGAALFGALFAGGFAWRPAEPSRSAAPSEPIALPAPAPRAGEGPIAPAPAASDPPTAAPVPAPSAPALVAERPSAPRAPATTPVGPPTEPSAAGRASADDLLQRARQARRAGRIDDAASLFTSAIEKSPTDSEALAGLAEVDEARGLTASALADYRRAIAVNPRYLQARLGLADLLWATGQRDEARLAYRAIVDQYATALCPDRARQRAAGSTEDDKPAR
jgi:serine/threonine protein kinase